MKLYDILLFCARKNIVYPKKITMKYLILIISFLITSLSPSLAAVSYHSIEQPPPLEKVQKKKRLRKRLYKKRKHPQKTAGDAKVVWSIIIGCLFATLSLASWIAAIWIFVLWGSVSGALVVLGFIFAGLAIPLFILASIYSKNRGIRDKKKRWGKNEGKATY